MQLYYQHTAVVQYFSEAEGCQPDYRRTTTGQWESRFGDTWEPMEEVTELEMAFVQWQEQVSAEKRQQLPVTAFADRHHLSISEALHPLPL